MLEAFPDARFVVLYRNPYETIPSLLKLLHVGWKLQGNIGAEARPQSTRVMTELSYETYLYPLEVLARHAETPRAIVDYRELVAAPKATIEKAYADLGLPLDEAYRTTLQAERTVRAATKLAHRYSLAEFGLEDQEIRRRLAPLFDRFPWTRCPADQTAGGACHMTDNLSNHDTRRGNPLRGRQSAPGLG